MTGWGKVHIHGGLWREREFHSKGKCLSFPISMGTRQIWEESLTLSSLEMTKCVKLKAANRRFQNRSSVQVPEQPLDHTSGVQCISAGGVIRVMLIQ